MNLNAIPAAVVIPVVIILYAFFWYGLMFLIGLLSGWNSLARKYRTAEPFEGKRWHFQKAQFRWNSNYGGMLTIGANAAGIYLKPMVFFRHGHPPLFIPWSETIVEMKKSIWFGYFMELQFPNVPATLIRIPEKLAKKIAAVSFPPA